MRTAKATIDRVAYWLERFTLAELVFVLHEDSRMSLFDKFRVGKIGDAVRHAFASSQDDVDVKMLIDDLSLRYCQTRPMHKELSSPLIAMRINSHVLNPFRSSCPTCNRILNVSDAKQRQVRIYFRDGTVSAGK
jgi:hypothetical protein